MCPFSATPKFSHGSRWFTFNEQDTYEISFLFASHSQGLRHCESLSVTSGMGHWWWMHWNVHSHARKRQDVKWSLCLRASFLFKEQWHCQWRLHTPGLSLWICTLSVREILYGNCAKAHSQKFSMITYFLLYLVSKRMTHKQIPVTLCTEKGTALQLSPWEQKRPADRF